MIIEKTTKVKGHYNLEVIKPNGDVDTYQQDNLLTDEFITATDGLVVDWRSTYGKNVYAKVGTGTTAPDVTDTELENEIAYKVSASSIDTSLTIPPEDGSNIYILRNVNIATFELGSIDDTVTEVGVSRYSSFKLISRALLDTPITIAPEDQLRIIWTIDMYLDTTPLVSTVDINGVSTEVTMRMHNLEDKRLWRPFYVNCMDVFSVYNLSGTTGSSSATTKSQYAGSLRVNNIHCEDVMFGVVNQPLPASGLVPGGRMTDSGFLGVLNNSGNSGYTAGNDILTTISEEFPDGNNARTRVYKSVLDTDNGNNFDIQTMFYIHYPGLDSTIQRNYWTYVKLTATFNPSITKTDLQRFEFDIAMKYERA